MNWSGPNNNLVFRLGLVNRHMQFMDMLKNSQVTNSFDEMINSNNNKCNLNTAMFKLRYIKLKYIKLNKKLILCSVKP